MDKVSQTVGKSIPRLGAYEKATGSAKYTGDLYEHNMLYCKLLRSPYAHALILNIDTSKAEKLNGVRAILTYRDVPKTLVAEDGPPDIPILADKVRYLGDEVAAVAADTEEIAERALELIKVKYKKLPTIFDTEEALSPDAPLIPPPETSKTNLLVGMGRTMSRDWGDVDKGFLESDYILEDEYVAGNMQHMALEPKAYVAKWEDSQLIVWACTQRLFSLRTMIAHALNLPENRVRVITPYVGGAFGGKGDEPRYPLIAALLSRKTKRPVRITLTREEDMLARCRPAAKVEVKIGFNKDKAFNAIQGKLVIKGGGYNGALTNAAVTGCLRALFRCSNCRFDARSIYTNHSPTGQLRGVMHTIMAFGLSQLVDKAAEEMGFNNPIDFIKKNRIQVNDPCDTINDRFVCTLTSCGLDECLDSGAKEINWSQKWKGWKTPVEVNSSKRVGMGMAAIVHDSAFGIMSSGTTLKVNTDGTAEFFTPTAEIGTGAITTQMQVASEASGIPLDDIYLINADSSLTPVDPFGLICSSSAHLRALAAKMAGEDVKKQLLDNAARIFEVPPEALNIQNGVIYVIAKPSQSMTIKSLMEQIYIGRALPVIGKGITSCPNYPQQKAFNYGAHFAMVEVDTHTGQIKVLRYVAAHDVGKALNPSICEAQIQGGVLMGISSTLTEEMIFDDKGKVLNLGPTDYKIYTAADSPRITPLLIESNDPLGPYGAKGFAEAPVVATPGCLANAIYNAIGIRFKELPITPERVLEAIHSSKH